MDQETKQMIKEIHQFLIKKPLESKKTTNRGTEDE